MVLEEVDYQIYKEPLQGQFTECCSIYSTAGTGRLIVVANADVIYILEKESEENNASGGLKSTCIDVLKQVRKHNLSAIDPLAAIEITSVAIKASNCSENANVNTYAISLAFCSKANSWGDMDTRALEGNVGKANTEQKRYYLHVFQLEQDVATHVITLSNATAGRIIPLTYTPFKVISELPVLENGTTKSYICVTGDDDMLHFYQEQLENEICEIKLPNNYSNNINAVSLSDSFPDSVLAIDFILYGDILLYIIGTGNGFVCMHVFDCRKETLIKYDKLYFEGPITDCKVFVQSVNHRDPSFDKDLGDTDTSNICVLLTSAVEVAVVYENVLEFGLQKPAILPFSSQFDSILCSAVVCNGGEVGDEIEIALGTYSQHILIYKFEQGGWELGKKLFLKHPIYSLRCIQSSELVATTMYGIYVLQLG